MEESVNQDIVHLNWLFSALFWVFVCLALTLYAIDAI